MCVMGGLEDRVIVDVVVVVVEVVVGDVVVMGQDDENSSVVSARDCMRSIKSQWWFDINLSDFLADLPLIFFLSNRLFRTLFFNLFR